VAERPRSTLRANTIRRGGRYYRLAEPDWSDSLDSGYSHTRGGRWNEPGAFPVLYLNDSIQTARLQVMHKLARQPYGPEDLNPDEQHDLIAVEVPAEEYLDCISDEGLDLLGLPASYPRYRNGRPVAHTTCRPVGQYAWDSGLPGIACRSAAMGAAPTNEELAFFDRPQQPRPALVERLPFASWW
jgi:hypothetical protein